MSCAGKGSWGTIKAFQRIGRFFDADVIEPGYVPSGKRRENAAAFRADHRAEQRFVPRGSG